MHQTPIRTLLKYTYTLVIAYLLGSQLGSSQQQQKQGSAVKVMHLAPLALQKTSAPLNQSSQKALAAIKKPLFNHLALKTAEMRTHQRPVHDWAEITTCKTANCTPESRKCNIQHASCCSVALALGKVNAAQYAWPNTQVLVDRQRGYCIIWLSLCWRYALHKSAMLL